MQKLGLCLSLLSQNVHSTRCLVIRVPINIWEAQVQDIFPLCNSYKLLTNTPLKGGTLLYYFF